MRAGECDVFSVAAECWEQGTSAIENIQMALDLIRLIEASNRSARSGQPVQLDSLAGV
jgi:hypothetical protein